MSRRNEGSITEIGPGRWQLRVSLEPDAATGKRRRTSRTFTGTEKQALRQLERMRRAEIAAVAVTDMTLAEAIDRHIMALAVEGRSQSTLDDYTRIARDIIIPVLGDVPIAQLTVTQLDDLYADETARGQSASSVRHVNAVISGTLTRAARKGWLGDRPTNVARYATKPAKPTGRVKTPPTKAVTDLYAVAVADETPERALAVATLVETGVRRGEVCGFRWSDLNGDSIAVVRNVIAVQSPDVAGAQLPSTNRDFDRPRRPRLVQVKSLKVDRPRRIALSPDLLLDLAIHRGLMERRAELFETTLDPDAYIFSDDPDQARPWYPPIVSEMVTRLKRRHGITAPRLLHGLRHHAATNMLANGIDPAVGAERLGHSSTKMFLDTYADATPARDQAAAELLGRILRS